MSIDKDKIFRERQAENGRKGGLETKKKGKEFYSKISNKRWKKNDDKK